MAIAVRTGIRDWVKMIHGFIGEGAVEIVKS